MRGSIGADRVLARTLSNDYGRSIRCVIAKSKERPMVFRSGRGIKVSMLDLERFIEESSAVGDFEGPVDESEVLAAEVALGVRFPPTYREFLLRLGVGDVNSHEFYGIIPGVQVSDEVKVPNVGITISERSSGEISPGLIIVGDTGMGEWYVLVSESPSADGDYPVKIWSPGAAEFVEGEEHEDFGEFALEMLRR